MEIWVHAKGLWSAKDFGLYTIDFSMVSSKKQGTMVVYEPWPNAFDVNVPLLSYTKNGVVII